MSIVEISPVIIAEVGSVHDGSFGNAVKFIELAKLCGADVAKFQTHLPECESTIDAPSPSFFSAEERYEYLKRTGFTPVEWKRLAEEASRVGIGFMSSVFSVEALLLLLEAGVKHIKVPSGEITNVRLLEEIAKRNVPTLLSTGMSNWAEIDAAVDILKAIDDLTIMQCTSLYPTHLGHAGVNIVSEMRERYPFRVGFSDHTEGNEAAILASAKGATVFEKHLTFSRHMYGSDAYLAREPKEFAAYVASIRNAHELISSEVDKDDISPFLDYRRVFMKGLYFSQSLKAGTILRYRDVVDLKPCEGVPSSEIHSVVGRALRQSVSESQPVSWEHF